MGVRRNLGNFDLEEEKDHFELRCMPYFPHYECWLVINWMGWLLILSFSMDFSSASWVLLCYAYANECFFFGR